MIPFAGDIPYIGSPIDKTNYFTKYGRVRIIDGHQSFDPNSWHVFNFGLANDGSMGRSMIQPFTGSDSTWWESAVFGGGNGYFVSEDAEVDTGAIWGFTKQTGWNLLYVLDLAGSGAVNQRNGKWFSESSSTETNRSTIKESGKQEAYDTLPIDYVGFSVHNRRNSPKIHLGLVPVVTSKAMVCCDDVTKRLGNCFGSLAPTVTLSSTTPTPSPAALSLNISHEGSAFLSSNLAHCSLNLTWKQLVRLRQDSPGRISTGGLGKKLVNRVKVWICDR